MFTRRRPGSQRKTIRRAQVWNRGCSHRVAFRNGTWLLLAGAAVTFRTPLAASSLKNFPLLE